MHFIQQLAVASALVSVVIASPIGPQKREGISTAKTFTVNQVVSQPGRKVAPAIALARAIGKYKKLGAMVPAPLAAAASKAAATDDGTVVANPQQFDSEYLEAVNVGSSTLQLDFDTGSSDLWVFSSELSTADQGSHKIYTPSSSSTLLNGESWQITYGDGSSAGGNVYSDTVSVGGTTVSAQAVEAASTASAAFVQGPNDGLLGLGFPSINTVTPDKQQTFFANAEASLQSPLFTADLKAGAPGSYNFGYIDDTAHTGTITYTNVDTSNGFWAYTTSGYQVGSGNFVSSSFSSIADTGTSLMLLPDAVVADYYAAVPGSQNSNADQGYVFPCSATLPDFTVQVSGYMATVPGRFINYAPASASGTCFGGIQSSAQTGGFAIFGDTFLKSQFVVFSDAAGGPQVGYAPKNL